MHPILFKIGSFTIYSYGFLLATTIYVCLYFLLAEVKEKGIDTQIIWDLAFWTIISGILGGKIAYIIANLPLYIQNPFDTSLWRGGFIFHGGFFLSLLTVFLYTKKKKLPFLSLADMFIPYVALSEAIGRIGCFLNGCCYGKPTTLPWGKVFCLNSPAGYHYGALPLHPTQLYSSLFLLILFLILKKIRTHQKFDGETLLFYLLFYPAFRFFLEFLRGDSLGKIFYGLTLFQIICVITVIISLVILLFNIKSKK